MLCESWWSQEEHKPSWPAQHPIATGLRIALGLLLPTHPQALLHPSMSARDTGSHAALQLVYGKATTFHSVQCCCLGVQGLTGVQKEESRGSLHTASRSVLMKKSQSHSFWASVSWGLCVDSTSKSQVPSATAPRSTCLHSASIWWEPWPQGNGANPL